MLERCDAISLLHLYKTWTVVHTSVDIGQHFGYGRKTADDDEEWAYLVEGIAGKTAWPVASHMNRFCWEWDP